RSFHRFHLSYLLLRFSRYSFRLGEWTVSLTAALGRRNHPWERTLTRVRGLGTVRIAPVGKQPNACTRVSVRSQGLRKFPLNLPCLSLYNARAGRACLDSLHIRIPPIKRPFVTTSHQSTRESEN